MTTMSGLDRNECFTLTIATKGVGKIKQKLPGITRSYFYLILAKRPRSDKGKRGLRLLFICHCWSTT